MSPFIALLQYVKDHVPLSSAVVVLLTIVNSSIEGLARASVKYLLYLSGKDLILVLKNLEASSLGQPLDVIIDTQVKVTALRVAAGPWFKEAVADSRGFVIRLHDLPAEGAVRFEVTFDTALSSDPKIKLPDKQRGVRTPRPLALKFRPIQFFSLRVVLGMLWYTLLYAALLYVTQDDGVNNVSAAVYTGGLVLTLLAGAVALPISGKHVACGYPPRAAARDDKTWRM